MKKNNDGEMASVRKRKRSREDWIVDGFAYGMAAILVIAIILPFMQVITFP